MKNENPQIDALDRDLRMLRIEFEKYFNGALDLPPLEQLNQIKLRLRDLRANANGSVERFRINNLESKVNSYSEMFNRRVRDIEEGRVKPRQKRDVPERMNVQEGVMVSGRIDESAAAALYQGLYNDKSISANIDVNKFRGYLNQQATQIRQKTGCAQVQFRLANEGGKLKLKAKPVKGGS